MKKILLVEDNETIIMGLKYSLEQENFQVISAKSVAESKEKINQEKIDIVLLDVSLPDGNGFDICKEIKEKQDIPVIFLTAQDEETSVVLGLDLGADDYIVKPFRTRELISRIKSVLRRYGQKEENGNIIQYKNIKIDTAGNFVNDNTLTVYIKRIREKLEDETIIKTVRGLGYRIGD